MSQPGPGPANVGVGGPRGCGGRGGGVGEGGAEGPRSGGPGYVLYVVLSPLWGGAVVGGSESLGRRGGVAVGRGWGGAARTARAF